MKKTESYELPLLYPAASGFLVVMGAATPNWAAFWFGLAMLLTVYASALIQKLREVADE